MTESVRIFFNITHGFQARMLLRSGVADRLLACNSSLVVCTPNVDEAYMCEECGRKGIVLCKLPKRNCKIERVVSSLRQTLLMNPKLGQTVNYKREELRTTKPFRYWMSTAFGGALGRSLTLRKLWRNFEENWFGDPEYEKLLHKHSPHLVVTGTPGYNLSDAHLLRAATRNNIRTATVMLSWDNLTSKGDMNSRPDHLLVWSQQMGKEAVELHDFPAEEIDEVGAAQFDRYFGFRQTFDRAAWRAAQDIPADAALIVYGTINPAILPHEIEIVRALAEAVQQGRFVRPTYLWIRLHPQVVRGVYSQALEPFLQLANEYIRVEVPPVCSSQLSWDLPASDAEHLASLIAAADVVATPSSTLILDAAALDTPIVSVQFDGNSVVPAEKSAARFVNYTHYALALRTGGVSVAYNLVEFIAAVEHYVAHPMLHDSGRVSLVQQQLGRFDGRAAERTSARLKELAELSLKSNNRDSSFKALREYPR